MSQYLRSTPHTRPPRDNAHMAIHRFVLHNDEIREAAEPMLRPGQLGLLSGWGVFSTLRIAEGVPFAFERHWARMQRDAKLMNIPVPLERDELRARLLRLIEANVAPDCTLRVVIVRNSGGMWEGPVGGNAADVLALTADNRNWGDSMRLCYQPEGRHSKSDFTRAKILSWSENLTWYERAHDRGFDECILLNELGEVTECTSANLFAVEGDRVWTPPLAAGCLPGITREILLEEIQVDGITISERRLTPKDLKAADSVFATSTTRDLIAVSHIEDERIGTSDTVRLKLYEAFREALAVYISRSPYKLANAVRG